MWDLSSLTRDWTLPNVFQLHHSFVKLSILPYFIGEEICRLEKWRGWAKTTQPYGKMWIWDANSGSVVLNLDDTMMPPKRLTKMPADTQAQFLVTWHTWGIRGPNTRISRGDTNMQAVERTMAYAFSLPVSLDGGWSSFCLDAAAP